MPSSHSRWLGILLLLAIPLAATADVEFATAADRAELESRERALKTHFEDRLRHWVVAATERDQRDLMAHASALLQRAPASAWGHAPLPAKPAAADWLESPGPGSDTSCTQVGHTLECVPRDDSPLARSRAARR